MEPIKEEERRNSQTTPEPDHGAAKDGSVEQAPAVAPTDKDKARSKKKLRFQRIRQSLGSVSSDSSSEDSSNADLRKTAHPAPSRWRMGMAETQDLGGIPGSILLFDNETKHISSTIVSPPSVQSSQPPTLHSYPRSFVSTPKTNRSTWGKRSADGKIMLVPQPDDSPNDPLNWPQWRKELAFISLGLLALIGGTMTIPFSSGLADSERDLGLSALQLGLVNGIFMVGLAIGNIFLAPTAVLYGKRLIFVLCGCVFVVASIWSALSPLYGSLIGARFLMGVALSPVETLIPSSIGELSFLHQRSFRLGIYVLLYLGGMNVIPVISGAIITNLRWRWLFWIWTIIGVFSLALIFLHVPESYYDRTLRPIHTVSCSKHKRKAGSVRSVRSLRSYFSHCTCPVFSPGSPHPGKPVTFERLSPGAIEQRVQAHRDRVLARINAEREAEPTPSAEIIISPPGEGETNTTSPPNILSPKMGSIVSPRKVGFADELSGDEPPRTPIRPVSVRRLHSDMRSSNEDVGTKDFATLSPPTASPPRKSGRPRAISQGSTGSSVTVTSAPRIAPLSRSHSTRSILRPMSRSHSHNRSENAEPPATSTNVPLPREDDDADSWPARPNLRLDLEDIMFDRESVGAFTQDTALSGYQNGTYFRSLGPSSAGGMTSVSAAMTACASGYGGCAGAGWTYTEQLRARTTPESWAEALRVWRGPLMDESWALLACKPLVLLGAVARPALCWATPVWALSVAYLAVLPRAVALLFASGADAQPSDTAVHYAFSPVQAGALSAATLIGLVLATLVAGPLAELVSRAMARRNGGVLEPEFRLLPLVAPGLVLAGMGSMGFGWVVQDERPWIVAAVFLAMIGFGCGATALAALVYVVDCVPGAVVEAMVVLAVAKNLVPGLCLELLLDRWIRARGPKETFLVIGAIHVFVLLGTIPMYMFGKRARGRRVRKTLVFEPES